MGYLQHRIVHGLGAAAFALALVGCKGTDAKINDRVRQALEREDVPAAQYQFDTRERIVTLTGVVNTEKDREQLAERIRDVEGVLGVDNRLTVQHPVETTGAHDIAFNPKDRAIRDAIRQRLDDASYRGVAVEVRDGVVILTGEVLPQDHLALVSYVGTTDKEIRKVTDRLVERTDPAMTSSPPTPPSVPAP